MTTTAEYAFATVSNDDAERVANEFCGPPQPASPTYRAYVLGVFDAHAAVDWSHPKQVRAGEYSRRRVATGRAFKGVR